MSRKRIFLLYLGFVTTLLVGTWLILGKTGVSRAFVTNLLARVIRPEHFKLRDAAVDFGDGVVTLRGFEVSTPAEGPGRARMAVEQVELGVETNPLGEPGRVREVRVRGLDLEIDLANGRFPNLARLLETSNEPDGVKTPDAPPPLEIIDSRLRLRVEPTDAPIDFREVALTLLPIEPGSSVLSLRGTMRGPNGETVTVQGRIDVAKPEVSAVLRMDDTTLSATTVRPYSREAGEFVAQIGAAGRIDSLAVWIEYPDRRADTGSATLTAGVRLKLSGVSCTVPQLPYPVVDATAEVSAGLQNDGNLRFRINQESPDGSLELAGELGGFLAGGPVGEFRVTVRDMVLGPTLGRALAKVEDARKIWDAFAPSAGRADAELRLEFPAPEAKPRFTMDLDLREVGVRFVGFVADDGTRVDGFPLPLREVQGRVSVRDEDIVLRSVRGTLDAGTIAIDGRIGKTDEDRSVRVHVASDDFAMSPAVRDALAGFDPGAVDTWNEYAPQGRTAFEFDIATRTASGPQLRLVLRPLGASAAWAGFPARVTGIGGSIEIDDREVVLDLTGTRGAGAIALRGRFALVPEAASDVVPLAELALRTGPLTIDPELRAAMHALSPTLGENVERFELEGAVEVTLTTWRLSGQDHFEYDVRCDLADASARFAVPVRSIVGPVFVQGSGTAAHIEISGVLGEIPNVDGTQHSSVFVHGTIATDAEGQTLDLTAVVRDLPLDESLGEALDRMQVVDLDTWHVLAPSGQIDLVWSRKQERGGGPDHQRMRLQLTDVGSDAAFLPDAATGIGGDVEIIDGVAQLSELRGRMAGADFTITGGTITHRADATNLEITVTSDDFPIDSRLANLLSGPMRDTFLERKIEGRVAIRELTLSMILPDAAVGFETRIRGRLAANRISASLGAELRDFDGLIGITDAHFDLYGGKVSGTLANSALTLFSHRIDGLGASFEVDTDRIAFRGLLGKLYGGAIQGDAEGGDDLVYRFEGPGELAFGLKWQGIDLARAMRESGATDSRMRGDLSGQFRLDRLSGADLVDITGAGELRVTGGDLGAVPAFTAIYSYLAEPRRPRFERLTARVRILDRKVHIDALEIGSPLLTATGKGSVDMAGWIDMRLDFPDMFGRDADWALIPGILRAMTSSFAQFQVHGELRAVQTRPLWIGREAANNVPLGPVPASSARRR